MTAGGVNGAGRRAGGRCLCWNSSGRAATAPAGLRRASAPRGGLVVLSPTCQAWRGWAHRGALGSVSGQPLGHGTAMDSKRWLRCAGLLSGMGLTVLMLACVAQPASTRSVLRSEHHRGPGSFCALNPEGCPPPASTQAEPGLFDLNRCLKACDAGGATLEHFCRGLAEAWQRQLCWSVVWGSKVACKNMCYRIHSCLDESKECPERAE